MGNTARNLALLMPTLAATITLPSCGGGGSNTRIAPPPTTPVTVGLTSFATGLISPVGLVQMNDGSGRFLALEQAGTIRIIQNGVVAATPYLDIRTKVDSGDEKGLLGLAFHPQFQQNGRLYLNYTRTAGGQLQSVISEYTASSPTAANPASERILLLLDQPFANHNGGQLAFGPDGFLYIGFGDGGSAGDPLHNGQSVQTLLGKILRIDVNTTSAGKLYGIPASNPFAAGGGLGEIWAFGLRNPWRFSFDTSGRLFCGDVGQDNFEEIDIIQRGGNYGWNVMEGAHCFNPASGCNQTGLILPIAEYNHSEGSAVIGGFVYSGSSIPQLQGAYVFGDLSSGSIWSLRENPPGVWTRSLLLSTSRTVSSFAQDQTGELYALDYNNGVVLKLTGQ